MVMFLSYHYLMRSSLQTTKISDDNDIESLFKFFGLCGMFINQSNAVCTTKIFPTFLHHDFD